MPRLLELGARQSVLVQNENLTAKRTRGITYGGQLVYYPAGTHLKVAARYVYSDVQSPVDGYTGREGKPVPLIIRKSDGGYNYGTTDLATIRHRVEDLKAHRVLYVIGAPQALHLNMVWDTARKAGWLPDDVVPVHVQIGNVLGDDRKILKTRSGKPLRLMELLDEAVEKARTVIDGAGRCSPTSVPSSWPRA